MLSFKYNSKLLVVACAVVCLVGVFVWKKAHPKEVLFSQKLVVGMMNGWPPFMSINQDGEYEGYDVDVAGLIAKCMGKELEIKDLGATQTIFIALEHGSIDIAMSGLDNTSKRIQEYNMVRYTSRESTSTTLLFWKKVPAGVMCLEDFVQAGLSVAVEPGSALDKYVDSFSNLSKVTIPAMHDAVMELRFGKVAAVIAEPRVAKRLSKQIPELVSLEQPLPVEFAVYGEGIALKKGNMALAADVAAVVEMLRNEGLLQQLEDKWQLDGGV